MMVDLQDVKRHGRAISLLAPAGMVARKNVLSIAKRRQTSSPMLMIRLSTALIVSGQTSSANYAAIVRTSRLSKLLNLA